MSILLPPNGFMKINVDGEHLPLNGAEEAGVAIFDDSEEVKVVKAIPLDCIFPSELV